MRVRWGRLAGPSHTDITLIERIGPKGRFFEMEMERKSSSLYSSFLFSLCIVLRSWDLLQVYWTQEKPGKKERHFVFSSKLKQLMLTRKLHLSKANEIGCVFLPWPRSEGSAMTFRYPFLPNSRFNQNLEGSIFAWLFVRLVVCSLRRWDYPDKNKHVSVLNRPWDKARSDQTRPELLDTMVDFPDTMVDLPDTMLDLPDTMVGLPDTMVDLPTPW